MRAINLYTLTRMKDTSSFSKFENALSAREESKIIESHEQESLIKLVDVIMEQNLHFDDFMSDLEGFYFGFEIGHISKEFDLLKLGSDLSYILNIELKSQPIKPERIGKQLKQNKYYLGHICRNIYSFTFVASTEQFYMLDEDEDLVECGIEDLIGVLETCNSYMTSDINDLFTAANYLISPLSTPKKFINHEYFLTGQQEEIKKNIFNHIASTKLDLFISITGSAGTGKTLLIYDIARECTAMGSVCVIHCGKLPAGVRVLKDDLENIDFLEIKEVKNEEDLADYDFILIDETQRIYEHQLKLIVSCIVQNRLVCIFSHDSAQVLSLQEEKRNVKDYIESLEPLEYHLSDKIRTNPQLASFIISLLDRKRRKGKYTYKDVDILYAKDKLEANDLIDYYQQQDYTYINYTGSNYDNTPFDNYPKLYNAHKVIGQEFDNVIMVLDSTFYYNQYDVLCSASHPTGNYIYTKMLFQGLTRTREKLCIIVVGNIELFDKIIELKL